MSLSVRGKTKDIVDPIVGKLTKDSTFSKDDNRILFLDNFQENKIETQGIKAIISLSIASLIFMYTQAHHLLH